MTAPSALRVESQVRKNALVGFLTVITTQDVDSALDNIPLYLSRDLWIGRDPSRCSPCFSSSIVSGSHFRIYSILYDDERVAEFPPLVYCEDQCSTNGTYVNDVLIGKLSSPGSPFLLSDGDVITIRPHWAFVFHQEMTEKPYELADLQKMELQLFRDRYILSSKRLGSGICGNVFLASEVGSQMQLACKIVDQRTESTHHWKPAEASLKQNQPLAVRTRLDKQRLETQARVIREIQILSKLSHPNIVTLHKAFRSPHTLYIFTELAAGGDLFSYLQGNGNCLEDLHARVISRQVTIAIEYLHSQGIAHRDLKLENILVMRRGIGHRVVLTDFGCAGFTRTPNGRMVSSVGTFDFLAPEFHKSNKSGYTEAIDMWSLGVVTLCLLTGEAIITFGELDKMTQVDIAATLASASHDYPKWKGLNVYGKDFIKKLLVMDPGKRMTAQDAINHDWFRKPASVASELDKLYDRANSFRSRRHSNTAIVEDLRDVTACEASNSKSSRRNRSIVYGSLRNKAATTSSRYFGLDQYLQPQQSHSSKTHRKMVLRALKDADTPFIDTNDHSLSNLKAGFGISAPHRPGHPSAGARVTRANGVDLEASEHKLSPTKRKRIFVGEEEYRSTQDMLPERLHHVSKARRADVCDAEELAVIEVDAHDMFGTKNGVKTRRSWEQGIGDMTPSEPDLQATASKQSPTVSLHSGETIESLEDPACSPLADGSALAPGGVMEPSRTDEGTTQQILPLARSYTLSQEDIELHDEVAKELPRLISAKIFSDAIARRIEMARTAESGL